jgi:hypothetical protein
MKSSTPQHRKSALSAKSPPKRTTSWYVIDAGKVSSKWLPQPAKRGAQRLSTKKAIRIGLQQPKPFIWVTVDSEDLHSLMTSRVAPRKDARLIVLDRVDEAEHHLLTALFRHVVLGKAGLQLVDLEALPEILSAENRDELFIAGAVVPATESVLLYNGNVEPMVLPLAWFTSPEGVASVNPEDFAIEDFGQTIRLGDFEASADAILYEFDREYRRKARRRAIDSDSSLGASIRRLRLQKGLLQSSFGAIDEKTIGRIERNEIKRPRKATLEKIAAVMGVDVEELGEY